jgi:hypothetical protein
MTNAMNKRTNDFLLKKDTIKDAVFCESPAITGIKAMLSKLVGRISAKILIDAIMGIRFLKLKSSIDFFEKNRNTAVSPKE